MSRLIGERAMTAAERMRRWRALHPGEPGEAERLRGEVERLRAELAVARARIAELEAQVAKLEAEAW